MSEKLNKLQIRAKVLEIIHSYKSEDDLSSNFHDFNIKSLLDLKEDKFVIEILLKELVSAENLQLAAIKLLISDIATLDMLEETIWNILKDKNITDKQKEKYLQLLRLLGGKIDVNMLMNCMDDFDNLLDEQTLELLQQATVNPEAQIDFLDFIFSLKQPEQIQLIKSLQDDFQGDELANILFPCLKINLNDTIKELVISILGASNSYIAVKPLKNFIEANSDNDLKKIAFKALNQLHSAGLEIDNEEILALRNLEVCKSSTFYKAYLSQVDGCGNQGLIFSRITDKKQIIMFSTVINITDGIIDCFGMHNIPIIDFQKVISRFKENDLVVPIEASEAKYILSEAEKINNHKTNTSPYEYVCWSVYTEDIEEKEIDYTNIFREEIKEYNNNIYSKLYDTEIFDSWFFEYDDNLEIQELIDNTIELSKEDTNIMYEKINSKIDEAYQKIFNKNKLDEYAKMLKRVAHVFHLNYNYDVANIALNLASAIQNGESKFLKDILRRSILQYLANIAAADEEQNNTIFKQNTKKISISEEEAFALLNTLEERWANDV